jgi:hypothetical protein
LSDEKKLKKEIRKKGAKWTAEETSISKLPPDEQRKRLGLLPTDEELKEAEKRLGKKKGC